MTQRPTAPTPGRFAPNRATNRQVCYSSRSGLVFLPKRIHDAFSAGAGCLQLRTKAYWMTKRLSLCFFYLLHILGKLSFHSFTRPSSLLITPPPPQGDTAHLPLRRLQSVEIFDGTMSPTAAPATPQRHRRAVGGFSAARRYILRSFSHT